MAYPDIYTAAVDSAGTLHKQVVVAVFKAAVDIKNEAGSGHTWQQRQAWARKILLTRTGPIDAAEVMVWKVLENATIQASPSTATDSDVQFVVNSIVDIFAGN